MEVPRKYFFLQPAVFLRRELRTFQIFESARIWKKEFCESGLRTNLFEINFTTVFL